MRRRARENGAWIRVAFIKKIRGHGIGRGASAGAGRVRHYISKRDLGRADAAGCAGCVYCVCPRQRFFGPSGIFGPAGAAGGGGRAARRTGGADGGALYGTWGRAGLVPLGVGLSSAAVYYCVRAAGARAIDASVLAKYHFLRDEAHVKFFLFLLFFIPGTPGDVLIYLGRSCPSGPMRFFSSPHWRASRR